MSSTTKQEPPTQPFRSDDLADSFNSLSFNSTTSTTETTWTASSNSLCNSTSNSTRRHLYDPSIYPYKVKSNGAPLTLSDFKFIQKLGSGDIGCVYLAVLKEDMENNDNARKLAIKVMDNKELVSRNKEGRAKTEREILEMFDHPFLPNLFACLESVRWYCLVTEFCPGGDLHVLRQRQPGKRFDEAAVRFYASEVVVALEYVHMMGIVYRDLKPENVLIRSDGHIMLTDFDLSLKSTAQLILSQTPSTDTIRPHNIPDPPQFSSSSCILPQCIVPAVSCFQPKRKRKKKQNLYNGPEFVSEPIDVRSMSFVGTHEYLAPEIVSGEGHGSAVDWWTVGIFIYELLYGVTPFKGFDDEYTMANIVARALEFPKEPVVSANIKDLIMQLLVKDPIRRMGSTTGATAIRHHAFFSGVNWALLLCTKPPHIPPPFTSADVFDYSCPDIPMDYF